MANIKKLEKKSDARGWLVEVLKHHDVNPKTFGQILFSTTAPGVTRGNHYHLRKHEWFCIVQGDVRLTLRNIETGAEEVLILSGDEPQVVEIVPRTLHTITNIGSGEMHLLAYVSEVFDPEDPDTFSPPA